MDDMKNLIVEIEKRIVVLNRKIEEFNNVYSFDLLNTGINEDNVWLISNQDIDKLNRFLNGDYGLTDLELKFLYVFADMPSFIKDMKKDWGLDLEQKKLLEGINGKINKFRNGYADDNVNEIDSMLKKYKGLLSKLRKNDVNLITEIDLVNEIMEKANFSFQSRLNILKKINDINVNIFNNYSISIDGADVLTEDDLTEVNMDENDLIELFRRFNISWLIGDDTKEKKIVSFYNKLLKYGDYDKFVGILSFLKDNDLEFIFSKPEILTKTLLYSSCEKLEQLKLKTEEKGINFVSMVANMPTTLFPTVREKHIKFSSFGGSGSTGSGEYVTSGSLSNFLGCITFLEKNGYDVNAVYNDCGVLFTKSAKSLEKCHDRLKMYGLSFVDNNGNMKRGFSALIASNVLEKLDIGIECGAYEYYRDNISKLVDSSLNLYRIKLARSMGAVDSDIFGIINLKKMNMRKLCLRGDFYRADADTWGRSAEDTFRIYGKKTYVSDNKEIYDNIVLNSSNDNISDVVLNDYLIGQLDSLYMDSPLTYNFDGVVISRLKVLRYYQTLIENEDVVGSKDVLMYVVTLFSMLNEDEYRKVESSIDRIRMRKRI